MLRFFTLSFLFLSIPNIVFAWFASMNNSDRIEYGFNGQGEYKPVGFISPF